MTDSMDSREKFKEALEKKRGSNIPNNSKVIGKSKIKGGQSNSGTQKMFRRKSGSS